MHHTRLVIFSLLSVVAVSASAAAEGFYVGGAMGQSFTDVDWDTVDVEVDGSSGAWKLYGGWELVRFLAVETGYVDMGKPEGSAGNASLSQDLWGWDACGLAKLNLGPLDVYGRYGLVLWRATLNAEDTRTGVRIVTNDGASKVMGVGAAVVLPRITLRAEYEHFFIEEAGTPDLLTVGATISF